MKNKNEESSPPTRTPASAVTSSINAEEKTLEIVISTKKQDRQGDIVEPAGLNFTEYLKNPVVLWAHDMSQPPVGKIIGIKRDDNQVTATVKFAETEFSNEVFNLYSDGYLNAWSVGFIPKKWTRLPKKDGAGAHITEAEVVEVSAVPVPANPEALTKALENFSEQQSENKEEEHTLEEFSTAAMDSIIELINFCVDNAAAKFAAKNPQL